MSNAGNGGQRGAGAITVRVPATSANLGPGFDSLGLALGLYDEITVTRLDGPRVQVDVAGEGAPEVPRDEKHLVVRAMHFTFDRLGVAPADRPGLALQCHNAIPHGRGLGSSAAAIVAGVLAASAMAGERADDKPWLLGIADELEGHPDNVAACLYGGLTIAWRDNAGAQAARLEPASSLAVVVFIPKTSLATATARGMLPPSVPHADAAHSAGRAALLIEAMCRRPDLLFPATEDRLHQGYRAAAMPATGQLIARLRAERVAAVVSGAGPSILALVAQEQAPGVDQLAELAGSEWRCTALPIDRVGAVVSVAGSGATTAGD